MSFRTLLLGALVALPLQAEAAPIVFAGTGAAGSDPLGNGYTLSVSGAAWGMPGAGLGSAPFAGSFEATAFRFTLAGGADGIDALASAFEALDDGESWTADVVGRTVTFTAPAGTSLAADELFYVNAGLLGAVSAGGFAFTASWFGPGDALPPVPVPAPAALGLLLVGLAGLGVARARR